MIKDMTKGNPIKVIFYFTMPMLLSVVFQQLYNIVDSAVAGKYIGVDALAAVGASYPITVLFIAVATGSSVGCSVVISRLFGAKEYSKMKTAVSTAVISLTALSIILMIVGFVACTPLMKLMKTPSDIFSDAQLYLNIYILGVFFLFIYNTSNAVFNGLGDSKTPLYFLIFSSVLNVVLDFVFVIYFNMGVSGVAWATFIAQGLSGVMSVITLFFRIKKIKVDGYKLFDFLMLKEICKIAIPSVMQQSFVSVGQLFVQGLVNGLGSAVVAGYSAAFKINMFSITAMNTMSSGLSSYVAQNVGAKKTKRITEGFKATLIIALVFVILAVSCVLLFGDKIIGLFVDSNTQSTEVINYGKQFLFTVCPFYFFVLVKIICDGVLRGAGDMREFMVTTFTDLLLRVLFSFIAVPFLDFSGICLAFPFGWIISMCISAYYYKKGNWKRMVL